MIVIKPNRSPKKLTATTVTAPKVPTTQSVVVGGSGHRTYQPFNANAFLPRGVSNIILLAAVFSSPTTVENMIRAKQETYEQSIAMLKDRDAARVFLAKPPAITSTAVQIINAYHALAYLVYGCQYGSRFKHVLEATGNMILTNDILLAAAPYPEVVGTLSEHALKNQPGGHAVTRMLIEPAIWALAYDKVTSSRIVK